MWRTGFIFFLAMSAFAGGPTFPKDSRSAKWIDRLDQWFATDADKVLTHLRATDAGVKKFNAQQLEDAKNNLTDEQGSSYMSHMKTKMLPEDFSSLMKIVSRKQANDALIAKWDLMLESSRLDLRKAFFSKYGVK